MRAALTLMSMLVALFAGRALAAEGSATETLKARDAEIREALPPAGGTITPEIRRKLETILTQAVDLRAMVQAAMGKHWAEASEKQRRRLVSAFEKSAWSNGVTSAFFPFRHASAPGSPSFVAVASCVS